jgi:hypothetical protein
MKYENSNKYLLSSKFKTKKIDLIKCFEHLVNYEFVASIELVFYNEDKREHLRIENAVVTIDSYCIENRVIRIITTNEDYIISKNVSFDEFDLLYEVEGVL